MNRPSPFIELPSAHTVSSGSVITLTPGQNEMILRRLEELILYKIEQKQDIEVMTTILPIVRKDIQSLQGDKELRAS